jgi:hypothetical protein
MNKKIMVSILAILMVCWVGAGVPAQVEEEPAPLPAMSIGADAVTGTAPFTVNFTVVLDDPYDGKYPVTYEWVFDDGAASTKKNPTHTFVWVKTYTVTCRATFWKNPKIMIQGGIEISSRSPAYSPWPVALTRTAYNTSPAAVSDGFGGVVITWMDTRNGSDNLDIYAQRINKSGNPLWDSNGAAVCSAAGAQRRPLIVSDGTGGGIISWEDDRNSPGSYTPYARWIDKDGKLTGSEDTLLINTGKYVNNTLQIIPDGAGSIIFSWAEAQEGTNNYEIYYNPFNTPFTNHWGDKGMPLRTTPSSSYNNKTIPNGSGGAVFSWQETRGAEDYGIYAMHQHKVTACSDCHVPISGGSTPLLVIIKDVRVCQVPAEDYSLVSANGGTEDLIITWSYADSSNINKVYAQRVDNAGNPKWTPATGVAVGTGGAREKPQIIPNVSGGAFITWQQRRSATGFDIFAQRIGPNGEIPWGSAGVEICSASGNQVNPKTVPDGSGGMILTWIDNRRPDEHYEIYAQRVNAEGKVLWNPNGVFCGILYQGANFPVDMDFQQVAGGDAGVYIIWQNNNVIFAQRVDKNGELK